MYQIQLAANSLFFGCALNICAHLDILRLMIHKSEMKEFIEYHRTILNLAKELNEIFKFIMIVEHLLLGVLICTIGFQLAMVQNSSMLMTIGFGITAIMELFIYSYGGQMIMDKSSEICKELYEVDKNYLFILMRTNREVKIKAGFFHICLPTLTSILNSAGSMMALLKSMV